MFAVVVVVALHQARTPPTSTVQYCHKMAYCSAGSPVCLQVRRVSLMIVNGALLVGPVDRITGCLYQ
jgi:hypothetical protein